MIPNEFSALVEAPYICARVSGQDRDSYMLEFDDHFELRAELSGRFRFECNTLIEFPVVGDYAKVSISEQLGIIHAVLPRNNLMARRSIFGSHDMQGIAANINRLFIVMSINRDFNPRRLERYLIAASANDVPCAVVLSKVDLCDEASLFVNALEGLGSDAPVLLVSAFDRTSLQQFDEFRGADKTISFVGSSGVGKSTLINCLLERDELSVSAVREGDQRGRHTTTRRSLLRLNDGTAVIDTPGMRQFALADAEDGVQHLFADISDMAMNCKFSDCTHNSEPGCAVISSIDSSRLQSWRKLEKEAAFQARSSNRLLAQKEKQKWKAIHKANRRRRQDEV